MDVILREPLDQLRVNSATEESNLACIHIRFFAWLRMTPCQNQLDWLLAPVLMAG